MFGSTNAFPFLDNLGSHLQNDLFAFLPEILICVGIIMMLLMRLFSSAKNFTHAAYVAIAFTTLALVVSVLQWMGVDYPGILGPDKFPTSTSDPGQPGNAFTGLLAFDYFTVFVRTFLLAFTILTIILTLITGIPDREDSADFHVLLLGASLGMCLMASTNHLLMLFISIEMASLPSYALAGFLKGRRKSSEAALKYVVYGGGAAGVMLYGISLIAGKFGTGYLPHIAVAFSAAIAQPGGDTALIFDPILILGVLFILIGLAFKLAAVPFHFWLPDVFEGASAEIGAFLSVASKAAALALLARLTLAFGVHPFEYYIGPALAISAMVTATFGNLAAYWQTNIKRLLAYSTIAQAGYMLMGLCVMNHYGTQAMLFFLIGYLFMNLGAFGIIAFIRNQIGSEELSDYRGLVRRCPVLVISLSICMLGLLGIPPLIGFAGKFQVFSTLYYTADEYALNNKPSMSTMLYVTLVFGLMNSVTSAVYYLKVLKIMILEQTLAEVEGREPEPIKTPIASRIFAVVMAACVFIAGVSWGPLVRQARKGVTHWAGDKDKITAIEARTPEKVAVVPNARQGEE